MTAKTAKSEFRATLTNEELSIVEHAMKSIDLQLSSRQGDNAKFLLALSNLIPLYLAIAEKGINIEEAIDKITGENIEVRIVRKGANDQPFNVWKNKLIEWNKVNEEKRIALTPSVFYKLIGGNVKAIQALYDANIAEITAHNTAMGLHENSNRTFAKRVDMGKYDNLIDWIKANV